MLNLDVLPSPALRPYVQLIWCLELDNRLVESPPQRVAPDATVELVRFIIGKWEGAASREPGSGISSRTYDFVLANRFIHERNTSCYLPRKEGEEGELASPAQPFEVYSRTQFKRVG